MKLKILSSKICVGERDKNKHENYLETEGVTCNYRTSMNESAVASQTGMSFVLIFSYIILIMGLFI